jgi:hypothetical protein
MGLTESTRTFYKTVPDLSLVAQDVVDHFRRNGYEVESQRRMAGGFDISLTNGGVFKTVSGLRTALKIELDSSNGTTWARCHIGIFGQQAIPTVISVLVFWPMILAQMWGLIQQWKLDEEAVSIIERSLDRHGGTSAPPQNRFCTTCGKPLPAGSRFCPECGAKAA